MAVAPHALAAQSALAVLREGGNAIEAMIAAAATIAVVYPHLNSLGGDGYWLISLPGEAPGAIDACGAAAAAASIDWYRERGVTDTIPTRGGLAATTVAGTVSGWHAAYKLSRRALRGRMPLSRLLADAIHYAEQGFPVTKSQAQATAALQVEIGDAPGFAAAFLPDGAAPVAGGRFVQRRLGATLRRLARMGFEDFYEGEIARAIARDLERAGSPLTVADLASHRARLTNPLSLTQRAGTLYNVPPPSRGVAPLMILGILDVLEIEKVPPGTGDYVHLCVEAAKQAFRARERQLDRVDPAALLEPATIQALAQAVDRGRAALPTGGDAAEDMVWLGVVDARGRGVSFMQSLHHAFGSGVVLDGTGITWQNRGASFMLAESGARALKPRRVPLHSLNAPLARLGDGGLLLYGAAGAGGQPQAQSAVFTRAVAHGMDAQAAVNAPRWLYGRRRGETSDTLKLESRFDTGVVRTLAERGHEIEILQPYDDAMGHAGLISRSADGLIEGAADPRSDGAAVAY